MFTILIYILLPVVFLIHDIEEILTYRKWAGRKYDSLIMRFPKARPMLGILHDITPKQFSIIAAEEFLIITLSVIIGIYYGYLPFMIMLFWGFSIHLFMHVGQAIIIRGYVPGLITSLLFSIYAIIGIIDLLYQYPLYLNVAYALIGTGFTAINLLFMHTIMKSIRS